MICGLRGWLQNTHCRVESNSRNLLSRYPALFLALNSRYLRAISAVLTRRLPACASFSCNRWVSSSCRRNCTTVYSPVILLLAWPAIWLASMLLPPTSCRHVMFARRSVCNPSPAKSHPSSSDRFVALLLPKIDVELTVREPAPHNPAHRGRSGLFGDPHGYS